MQRLDWTQPLELNGRGLAGEVTQVVRTTDERVTVRIGRGYDAGEYHFHPTTGVMIGHENRDDQCRIRNASKEVANHFFRVWFGHESWSKDSWRYLGNDAEYQFTDPKLAQAKVKALNAEAKAAGSPCRFMTKPHTQMSPDHKWRSWMRARFESGEYTKLPWADEEWAIKDHFAHPSLADPFKVAYVVDENYGVKDRMTVVAPGSYLQQYYSDKLSAQEIAAWAVKLDSEAELKFATTPEEIERIYTTSGINSCMQYRADHFPARIHPVRVYGAGDLELAYLERRGKVVARALVRRSNLKVQRVYGDGARLMPRLEAEGFTSGENDPSHFVGARILNIKVGQETVMPYLDWSLKAKDNPDDPNTLLLCTTGGTYSGGSTNGIASGRSIHTCGHTDCTETFSDGATGTLYSHDTGRAFCPTCSTTHLSTCRMCGQNTLNSGSNACVPIMTATGRRSTQGSRPLMICACCVRNEGYTMHEGGAYSRSNTVIQPGTRTRVPRHTVADLQEA